jgi:hypothetical protein
MGSSSTFILQWVVLANLVLGGLVLILAVATVILRRFVSRQALRIDRDLVGLRAEVTRAIRPGHTGLIRCQAEPDETLLLDAASDRPISRGTTVLITAVAGSFCEVLPIEGRGKPDQPQ